MPTLTQNALALRPATAADADLIHALTRAAYAEYAHTDAPSTALDERVEDLRAALLTGETRALIVETDGRPVASVRYRIEGAGLYFFRLGVVPTARGMGIARLIVCRLESIARAAGATALRCKVRLIVPRNVRLYESIGFELTDTDIVLRGSTPVPTAAMEKILK